MTYEKRELVDGSTIVDKELLDYMQDGIINAQKGFLSGNQVTLIIPSSSGINSRVNQQNTYLIRCPDYSTDKDFVWWLTASGGSNGQTNIQNMFITNKDTPDQTIYNSYSYSNTSMFELWKAGTDDTAPINFNGSYIGGNHGATIVEQVNVSSHDKTEKDIGSIWTSNSHTYMLVKINTSSLWFIQTDNESFLNGTLMTSSKAPTETLVHSQGATNTSTITINSVTSRTQLTSAINHLKFSASVDDEPIDTTVKGIYKGKKVTLTNQYDIIYPPAVLTYLSENIGNNTNKSFYDDAITERFCTVMIVHEIHSNGSMSLYQRIKFHKDVSLSTNFIAQFGAFTLEGEESHEYVPDTIFKTITENTGTSISFAKENWDNQEKVPYRFYTFASAETDKGYTILYDRSYGIGENEKRLKKIGTSCGSFAGTKKLYPCIASGVKFTAGTSYDAMAVRIPLAKYHDDLTSVTWYWRKNKDIILLIDSHKLVNIDLVLPEYMANKNVEVLDKTDSVISEPAMIGDDHTVYYATDSDYGYMVLRLFN